MMTVEEKPDVTYNDIGGCKEQIEKMREVSGFQISDTFDDLKVAMVFGTKGVGLDFFCLSFDHVPVRCNW